ncbi:GDSL-type esterase/lipase family protein [Galbibacter sp. PAP.153]|uniref:SGNH/GDSL hydrolase family protein n=1 Tax=Galbibacter sp. PAP.153 TaxID=3104623 RepID=UPI00300BE343
MSKRVGVRKYLLAISSFLVVACSSNSRQVKVINAGIPGNNSEELLNRIRSGFPLPIPDIAIIMVGTNDMLNTGKMLTYHDYEHNLKLLVAYFQRKGSKVILASPPPIDSIYLFERHDKKDFLQSPNVKLDSVREKARQVSAALKTGFVDVFKAFKNKKIPDHNRDIFIQNPINTGQRDGVHPTAEGARLIARLMAGYIQDNGLCRSGCSIYCLGDSITYGKGLKGEGSTNGETYPAFLSRLLH